MLWTFAWICEPPHDKTKKMTWPSEDSDQPGHSLRLIRVFAVGMEKPWVLSFPLSTQRRLFILGGCPGWSESSMGAQIILLVLSWGGSYYETCHHGCMTRQDANWPSRQQQLARIFGISDVWNHRNTTLAVKIKGADQTAQMCRLTCFFVIHINHKQVFLWTDSYFDGLKLDMSRFHWLLW